MNTRALTTKLIHEVLTKKHSLSHLLPTFKKQCKNTQDAAFIQALAFGVIRWYPRLLLITNKLLQKPIKQKDIELAYLICIGIYQLTEMRIPEHAVIHETVEAAKVLNKSWAASLVNAVLRSYQRQFQDLQKISPIDEEAYYAHPSWLIHTIKKAWPQEWETILGNNNLSPPLSLRINLQKETQAHYIKRLEAIGLSAAPIPYTKSGIILKVPTEITMLPGFKEGLFSVQDTSAQFAVEFLQLAPHLCVLDACAAPGGKTAHMLEIEPTLEVVAIDISESRNKLMSENLNRLNLKATVLTADAKTPTNWWNGKFFDRILLDAPCSATGVIRRHPDIKYLRKLSDITKLASQQTQLLNALWPLLKPGGILVYATCSIFPDENLNVVQLFLNQQKDAVHLPVSMPYGRPQVIGHQFLPGQNEADGFYYARILKV